MGIFQIRSLRYIRFSKGQDHGLALLYITFIWSPVNLNGENKIMPFGGKYLQEMVKWTEG